MKTLCSILTNEPAKQMVIGCFGYDLTLSECSKPNMKKLALYMQEHVAKNTARTYAAYIKSALNLYKDTENVPANFAQSLQIRGEATISVYLTEEELKRLYLAAKTQTERYYILHFLISAFEGCRCSDVKHISESNIINGTLRYVCQKTGCKAEVPARKELPGWLEEIKSCNINFCDRTYNRYIKDVCEYAGVDSMVKVFRGGKSLEDKKYNFVSSHTARRSFATNLYLRGCDLYTISRYMGHSDMQMTARYICSETKDLNESIKEFFNN